MGVAQLALHMALQLLDDQLGVGQGMGSARAPRLAHSIGIVRRQQALEDVAAGTPLPVRDIVALGGRLAVLARRAHIVVIGHAALAALLGGVTRRQGAGTLGAQGIDGGILEVLGDTEGQTGGTKAPGSGEK